MNDSKQAGVDVSTINKNAWIAPKVTGELKTDLSGKSGQEIMAAVWNINPNVAKEIANMNHVNTSSYGMFASIPIVCQKDNCAYKNVCMVSQAERIEGRRCPMEISAILSRFEMWCMHFNIDISDNAIDPKDAVDVSLIKDLVNIEIQIMRAENKIALNGDFMAKTLLEVDRKCNPYFGEDIHPATNFLVTLQTRKDKILNQLHATRKDKAADLKKSSPSDDAIKLFREIKEMQNLDDITDVEFDEEGNIIYEEVKETTVPQEEENEPQEQSPDRQYNG